MIRPKLWKAGDLFQYYLENQNLVSRKPVPSEPGLYILKYKKKVFFDALWTPELCEFRGTVVDDCFRVIMRPLTKIFNYGESGATIAPTEECIAVNKINGYMAQATVLEGRLLVATTGTMDSEFAVMARKWIAPFEKQLIAMGEGMTYIFEICDPSDPHIIKETAGIYLLSVRTNAWNTPQSYLSQKHLDALALQLSYAELGKTYPMKRPLWHRGSFQIFKDQVKTVKHEGFVIYGLTSGDSLKMKSPFYLTTKFIGRMGNTRLEKLLDDPHGFKKTLDEEFYPVIDYLCLNQAKVFGMSIQERIEFVRTFFEKTL